MEEGTAQEPLLQDPAGSNSKQVVDTFWPCVANLSKVIIGAGMMAIPQAYCRIGWLAGTFMLVLVGLMTYTTLIFLLCGSAATGASTYSQLTRVTLGPVMMKVLQVAVLSFCFGFGVVYLVIIRDILLGTPPVCNGLLCELFGLLPSSPFSNAKLVIVAVALLICSPLLLLRSMDRLALLNVVGVGAIALLATVAVGLAVKGLATGSAYPIPAFPQWQQLGRTKAEQLQALTAVMPVMIACYVAHQSLHPLVPLLQPYSHSRMSGVVAAALLTAFGVFGSLAVGSGLAFGPTVEVNVLNNFSVSGLQPLIGVVPARILSWTIRGGYLLCLLASLLLYMHPLRGCLAEMIWPDSPRQAGPEGFGESASLLSENPDHGDSNSDAEQPRGNGQQQLVSGVMHAYSRSDPGVVARARAAAAAATGLSGQQSNRWTTGGSSGTPVEAAAAAVAARQVHVSVFATPAAQAAAAAAAEDTSATPAAAGQVACGSPAVAPSTVSSGASHLSTFDSMDNPRTGSWTGVKYLTSGLRVLSPSSRLGAAGRGNGSTAGRRSLLPPVWPAKQQPQQLPAASNGSAAAEAAVRVDALGSGGMQQADGYSSACEHLQHPWQQGEQRWYFILTYGLLTTMVLVAIVVPNIWTALSAIGDLASTLQAFVVPGAVGVMLATHGVGSMQAGSGMWASPWKQRRTRALNAVVGVFVVLLGLTLFANGIYQRL